MYSVKIVLIVGADAEWSAGFNAATIRVAGNASGTRQNLITTIYTRPIAPNGDTMSHMNAGWVNNREADIGRRRIRRAWSARGRERRIGALDVGH